MSGIKVYRGEGIAVQFDAARCIHAAECVRGLPAVFDPQARPWIQPTKAAADELAAVVARCPSGALQTTRDDGRPTEVAPAANEARLVADGPLYLRGSITLREPEGAVVGSETRMALCRCGASRNKPYCDNSHAGAGFTHDGTCAAAATAQAVPAEGALTLTPGTDGPLQCDGPLRIVDAFGEAVAVVEQTWLCRCGASQDKPYCDGSHQRVGFRS